MDGNCLKLLGVNYFTATAGASQSLAYTFSMNSSTGIFIPVNGATAKDLGSAVRCVYGS